MKELNDLDAQIREAARGKVVARVTDAMTPLRNLVREARVTNVRATFPTTVPPTPDQLLDAIRDAIVVPLLDAQYRADVAAFIATVEAQKGT